MNEGKAIFADTAIKVTIEGNRHLGAALAHDNFRREYAMEKVTKWCKDIEQLCYAKSQPQAVYAAFIHRVQHKYKLFYTNNRRDG